MRDRLIRSLLILLEEIEKILREQLHHHRKAPPLPPQHVTITEVIDMKTNVTWVDPTQRTDGTALPASQIAFINVLLSADGTNYTSVGNVAAGVQTLSVDLSAFAPGAQFFVKAETVDTQTPPDVSAD